MRAKVVASLSTMSRAQPRSSGGLEPPRHRRADRARLPARKVDLSSQTAICATEATTPVYMLPLNVPPPMSMLKLSNPNPLVSKSWNVAQVNHKWDPESSAALERASNASPQPGQQEHSRP